MGSTYSDVAENVLEQTEKFREEAMTESTKILRVTFADSRQPLYDDWFIRWVLNNRSDMRSYFLEINPRCGE
jgi:hypothetical protein